MTMLGSLHARRQARRGGGGGYSPLTGVVIFYLLLFFAGEHPQKNGFVNEVCQVLVSEWDTETGSENGGIVRFLDEDIYIVLSGKTTHTIHSCRRLGLGHRGWVSTFN